MTNAERLGPASALGGGEPPEPDDTENDEREAQSEDPTSPERGFEQVEQHDADQEES